MKSILFWFIIIFFLVGCNGRTIATTPTPITQSTSMPTVTSTSMATASANATSTLTLTLPPTLTPTFTPTLPATLTPTLSPTLPPTATPVIEIEGALLPPGFSLTKYADLYRPTSLTFDPNGRLFATSFDGTVHVFTDEDGDGRSDQDDLFAWGFATPLGVVARTQPRDILVSSTGKISVLRDTDGNNRAETIFNLVDGLPNGLHQNNNLKFGPDGWLYMGVGSTCDVCDEADERSATIMRFDPVSGAGEVVATGLRNAYDLAWHPLTGDLFATENGRDDLGVNDPPEELNWITSGSNYGWPGCWGEMEGSNCEGTTQASGFFAPRSSANSIEFYTGDAFPQQYRNSAFVTLFGSFETRVDTGILQLVITPSGESYSTEMLWFVTYPDARPLGLTIGPDGALYFGDYFQDAIYRVSYGE